jgi:hypothetical protein
MFAAIIHIINLMMMMTVTIFKAVVLNQRQCCLSRDIFGCHNGGGEELLVRDEAHILKCVT